MWEIRPSVLLESRVASKQTQALLSKNKLPVWSNPWTIQQLVDCASFKVLAKLKLKPWEIFSVENSKIKHAHWQIKKQINAQVKLHFENDTLRSGNTGNIFLQLVLQRCCSASWNSLFRVLPPAWPTCLATKYDVAGWGDVLRKVDSSSTFCNKF